MATNMIFKPSYDEWQNQAQVVIDRLTTCVHVYTKPPHEDVFMPEKERQEKNAHTLKLLRSIYGLIEDTDTPTDSLTEVAYHDERVISGLRVLILDALSHMPSLSLDMQKLLKSPWFDKCNGRLANELFRGPMNNEKEGIGSGYPEHGRLPLALKNLLERETDGEKRQPRQELHRPTSYEPQRSDEKDDLKRRWADQHSQFIRSSGGRGE